MKNRLKELFFNSRLGFALFANILVLLVSLVVFRPLWEENDDIGMALIAEGAYGYHDPHILYSNVIYGRLLCILQSLLPGVRWHAVIMITFTFVIMTAFVYLLAETRKGKVLSVFLLLCSFYEIYVSIQFSKISALIAIASYMILFNIANTNMTQKSDKTLWIIAMLCMVYAQLLRWESFALATMSAFAFGVCFVTFSFFRGRLFTTIKTYFKIFTPVFAIFVVGFAVNSYAYSQGSWGDYMNYFRSMTQVVDYHYDALSMDKHGSELSKLGISENDAMMLVTYENIDTDYFTTEILDRITAIDPKGLGYIDDDLIKAWVANIYNDIFKLNSIIMGIVMLMGVLMAYLYRHEDRKVYYVNIVLQTILTVAVLLYYQYSSRWSHRIVYSLFLIQVVQIIYMLYCTDGFEISAPLISCILFVLVTSAIYLRLGNEFEYRQYEREIPDYNGIIEYMEDNKEKIFAGDVFTMLDYGRYDIFKPSHKSQFDNYVSLDSVYLVHSPIERMVLERYGFESPFEAFAAGDNRVVLIDNRSPEIELVYCNEHGSLSDYRLDKVPNIDLPLYTIR